MCKKWIYKHPTLKHNCPPHIQYMTSKCLNNFGACEWIAHMNIAHNQWSGTCCCLQRAAWPLSKTTNTESWHTHTHTLALSKIIQLRAFINEAQAKDQRDTECTVNSRGARMLRWAANELRRKVQCNETLYAASLCLQPMHAHAIAPLLSGGCLDAVKSCF